jgi:hypothetical protein
MFIEEFTGFLEYIWWFLSIGIWQPLKDLYAYFIILLSGWFIEMKIDSITFAWGVAKSMLYQLSFNDILDNLFNGFNSQIKDMLLYFKVPDFVYTLVTAYMTRYVMAFTTKLSMGLF